MDTGFSGGFITVHGLTLTLLMRGYLKGNGLRLVSILSYGFINDDVLYKQWHLKFIDIGHLASFRKIGSPAFWIGAHVLGPTRKALGDMKQWKQLSSAENCKHVPEHISSFSLFAYHSCTTRVFLFCHPLD